MRAVVTVRCEDNLSPLLRSISRSMLMIASDAKLPPFPTGAVIVESEQHGGDVDVRLLPSADLTAWISDVKRMAAA